MQGKTVATWWRIHWPFFLIAAAALALRLAPLATSQRYADGDEAVVGVMAKHILEKGERLVFPYAQPYGGGGAIEAYLVALSFRVLGISSISLKLVGVAVSMATLLAAYLFCVRHLGLGTARLGAGFLAVATPLIEWNSKVRGGGNTEAILFSILIVFAFCRIAYRRHTGVGSFLALGLVSGLAWWNSEIILSCLVALAVASLAWGGLFLRLRAMAATAGGFIVGCSPMLVHDVASGFDRWHQLYQQVAATGGLNWGRTLAMSYRLPLVELPRFFTSRNVDQFVTSLPTAGYVECGVTAALVILVCVISRSSLRRIATAWIPVRRVRPTWMEPRPEALLAWVMLVHLLFYAAFLHRGQSPRYFLPLYPGLALVCGAGVCWAWRRGGLARGLGAVACLALVGLGLSNQLRSIGPSKVNDDVLTQDLVPGEKPGRVFLVQRRINEATSGEAIPQIIALLKAHGIRHVRTTFFVQWRLIFESKDEIIASSRGLTPGAVRYPAYDEEVDRAESTPGVPVARVFHQRSWYNTLPELADFQSARIDSFIVYWPKSAP